MLGLNFFCNDSAELAHDVGLFSRNNEEAGPKYMKKHRVYTFFDYLNFRPVSCAANL